MLLAETSISGLPRPKGLAVTVSIMQTPPLTIPHSALSTPPQSLLLIQQIHQLTLRYIAIYGLAQ